MKEIRYVLGFLLTFFLPALVVAIAYTLTDNVVVRGAVFLAAILFAVFVHGRTVRTLE